MSYKIIPLTTDPDQNFTITLPIDGKNITLFLRLRYNTMGNYWWLSVTDYSGKMLIDSLPLLTGDYPAADILEQYAYLNIGSACVVKTGTAQMDIPDDTNLGTEFVLVWGDRVV